MIRCAVVGVGFLGRYHAQKYKSIPGVEFVGVCDTNSEQGEKIAKELEVKYFSNAKDLIGKVDAVTIAASTSAHYELTKLFLSNGIHVHVEKPLTSTSVQGEELCALAAKKNLKLQVGHVERFNPALISAKEKLRKPLFIECHRLAPFKPRGIDVDVVLDLMIHDLDVILSLVNSEPEVISAVGSPVLTKTNDIASARVEFKSGAVANITASRVSQKAERKFRVFQPDQYLSIDFGAGSVQLFTRTEKNEEDPWAGIDMDSWNLEKGDALMAETQSFVRAIVENKPCEVSGLDGLKALRLAEQIITDIESRKSKFADNKSFL